MSIVADLNETLPQSAGSDNAEEIGRMIHVIGLSTITVFGTIGNLLAFTLMRRGSLKKVSTCFYMAILALADTGVIWTTVFEHWVGHLTRWTFNPYAWTNCKLGSFLFYGSSHYSSSLLCVMSFEKFFALYFPLKTKSICTVKTAKRVCVIFAVFFAAFDFQFFFIIRAEYFNDGTILCVFDPPSYESTFFRMDSIFYSFGPFTIIIIINSAIIYKFTKAKFRSKNNTTESTNQALSKSAMKGTAMLITVSTTFILLTAPIALVYSLSTDRNPIAESVSYSLGHLNHSINGVLYCIVGSRFRNELITMLCCGRGPQRTFSSHRGAYVPEPSQSGTATPISTISK